MSLVEVVVFTTSLAFCFFVGVGLGRKFGYRKGYEVGAKIVLKQWNNWLNEVEDMENE